MSDTPNVKIVDAGPRMVARQVVVAASPGEIFALLADPRRHGELDGSGTVGANLRGPARLGPGDTFSTAMRIGPVPYRVTCTVSGFEESALLEWRHPLGHLWRWELTEVAPGQTEVTETWDYRANRLARVLELAGLPRTNGNSIARTLEQLRSRYAVGTD